MSSQMKKKTSVVRINGRMLVMEQFDDGLSYLLRLRLWNPVHLVAYIKHLVSPDPEVVTIEGLDEEPYEQDSNSDDDLSRESETNS